MPDTVQISVPIPEQLHRALKVHVAKEGIKVKDFVVEALEEALEKSGASPVVKAGEAGEAASKPVSQSNSAIPLGPDLRVFLQTLQKHGDEVYQPWIVMKLVERGKPMTLKQLAALYEKEYYVPPGGAPVTDRIGNAVRNVLAKHGVARAKRGVVELVATYPTARKEYVLKLCREAMQRCGVPPAKFVPGGLPGSGKKA